jgi:hypothetical protein
VIVQPANEPVDVSQLRATERAVPTLLEVVRSTVSDWSGCEVIDYGPAALTADGEVMWKAVGEVPLLQAIADESDDPVNLPVFDPTPTRLRNIRFAVLTAQASQTRATFIQSLRGSDVVAQSTRRGFLVRKGVLDVPRSGQMVLLSREVAAMVVGEFAFFRDRKAFQRLFGYLDELRAQADSTFTLVTTDLRIEGVDQMRTAVTSTPAMLGKVASIQRKLDEYPQYRAALTMPKLKAFVEQHPECGVQIVGEGEAARFLFQNDAQHRFKILKLLDDDYLRSELTALEYEANSKSAPIGGTN